MVNSSTDLHLFFFSVLEQHLTDILFTLSFSRDERRWIEKQNRASRAQRKKEEMNRIRTLVGTELTHYKMQYKLNLIRIKALIYVHRYCIQL